MTVQWKIRRRRRRAGQPIAEGPPCCHSCFIDVGGAPVATLNSGTVVRFVCAEGSVFGLLIQSGATPALAPRFISGGGKPSLLLSYHLFLHLLMTSQSVHKFVLICLFENFGTAAGCTGMKALRGRAAKMELRGGRGGVCLNGFLNDHPLVCIFITGRRFFLQQHLPSPGLRTRPWV